MSYFSKRALGNLFCIYLFVSLSSFSFVSCCPWVSPIFFVLFSPNSLGYTGNVVLSLPTHSSFVPYVTGGVGGLTMFEKAGLGINSAETFLTGNAGGGVKWYAPNGRWGLRGDYRFMATQSKDDAPAFFGQDTRYGHRVYGAVIITAVR